MSQYVTTPDGVEHEFPDEATPQQIKAALAGVPGRGAPPMAMSPQFNPLSSMGRDLRSRALGLLPAAGGLAGGLAGTPAGLPGMVWGAGIGGAAGEGARQALEREKFDPMVIARQGASQGLLEAGGGFLAAGAGAVARPIMRRALGVGKSLNSDFPGIAENALQSGIAVSAGGKARATMLRNQSAQALTDLLSQASKSGTRLNTRAVLRPVRDLLRSNVIPEEEKAAIVQKLVSFIGDKTARIDPVLLKEIKQFYQNRAKSAYRAAKIGGMSEAQAPGAAFSRALASGAKQQLETIPGVAQREATTQGLIGVERAVKDAVTRPPKPFELHKPGTYPLPFVSSPHVVSRVALTINSPMFKAVLRQSPRAAAALVMDLIHTDTPDATGGY